MTTERLYLRDPYITRFSARVLELREVGGRPAAVLDRSAFYPEGGGQPGDRGTLGDARVLDTQAEDDAVLHFVDRPLPVGGEVQGEVDGLRRRDHMQQHHGQHLLSAAFVKVLAAPTTSFHLGERTCTIDLAVPVARLDEPALRAVEAEANASVWRNLPVVARDFVGEERARLSLRKEAVKGDRVVVVEGVDASPCGGTHPARTGDVGAIAVLGAEKWGAGTSRVEFACGARVVALLAEANRQLWDAARALSTGPAELPGLVSKLAAEVAAGRKQIEVLQREVAVGLAARLSGEQPEDPVVARVEGGANMARGLGQALQALGRTALVAAVEEGRAFLCFARPRGAGPNMGELLRAAVATLGGKGGGSPELAQGSGDAARLDEALSAARAGCAG